MASITVRKKHGFGIDEARKRVARIEPTLREKYGVTLVWSGERATIKGKGVSGSATVDGEEITMALDLSFLLRPLTEKIRSAIERKIDEALEA